MLTLGQTVCIYAFRFAAAPVVSTVKYSGILWSVVLSAIVWQVYPSGDELIGAGLIVASGVAIVLIRDRRMAAIGAPILPRQSDFAKKFSANDRSKI